MAVAGEAVYPDYQRGEQRVLAGWDEWDGYYFLADDAGADAFLRSFHTHHCLGRANSSASETIARKTTSEATVIVKRIEFSSHRRIEIFSRPGNTYGYYFVEKYADGRHWMPPTNMGDGSVYDTCENAEAHARQHAANLDRHDR